MTEEWDQAADGEQDDDLICMNGAACDHPCCPEHADGPEDSHASDDTQKLVRDLLTRDISTQEIYALDIRWP